MSASKVLDMAERQGLLEPRVIGELRRQVADSKFVVTPEAIAKVLVDHGHLTAFQARKLVATALGEPTGAEPGIPPTHTPPPPPQTRAEGSDELALLSDSSDEEFAGNPPGAPAEEDDVVMMEAVEPPPQPA